MRLIPGTITDPAMDNVVGAGSSACPSPGCPATAQRRGATLFCPTHGPVAMLCVDCGARDGRTDAGGLLCENCRSAPR